MNLHQLLHIAESLAQQALKAMKVPFRYTKEIPLDKENFQHSFRDHPLEKETQI